MSVCVGYCYVRRMSVISTCWRRVEYRYDFFPSTFAITMMSIRHSVFRKRETLMLPSSCLLTGTNLSLVGLRWVSVVNLGWERMECVLQGESSHAGSIKTPKNGLLVVIEHAIACRTDFCRSSVSNSGTARHEHVHR